MYDILEVFLMHKPGSNKQVNIDMLQRAVAPNFELEPLEFVSGTKMEDSRQIVRFAALGREYESADAFEDAVKGALAESKSEDQFHWQRVGVVRVGQTDLILG